MNPQNLEIERKFLVIGPFKHLATKHYEIRQGYICSRPEKTVRVRTKGPKAYLTIKGEPDATGTTRFEWETEIAVNDAHQLLQLCDTGLIEKVRYLVPYKGHTFEVDEFFGQNVGLIMAEVELTNYTEKVDLPHWIGAEVTNDARYYNSALAQNPFTLWPTKP
jgi:adenylate cyclase